LMMRKIDIPLRSYFFSDDKNLSQYAITYIFQPSVNAFIGIIILDLSFSRNKITLLT